VKIWFATTLDRILKMKPKFSTTTYTVNVQLLTVNVDLRIWNRQRQKLPKDKLNQQEIQLEGPQREETQLEGEVQPEEPQQGEEI
jgi:hypothetical protein